MTLLGADLPVVLLTLAALVCVIWGWVSSLLQGRIIRRMAAWLEREQPDAWNALPWASRRLMPQSGIAAMKRQGLTEDRDFQDLEAQAERLRRRVGALIFAGFACFGLLIAGMALLGWAA